ncbi:hypothetical protein C4D60_Mb02t22780 [Musa balbisiana]|uniref:F-box domain-containing protein n=1 Tax=Musa balbisiana TaxID=52838 RepID=A0A4S8ICQ3_MUSBA|nr:hypothetical protein C4D60_Mb02t22780 [Musa balbisiana]
MSRFGCVHLTHHSLDDCDCRFAERVVEAFGPKEKRPMGSFLSLPHSKVRLLQHRKSFELEYCKRLRMSANYGSGNTRLIPCLPDEISLEILARVPRICYLNMKMVSRRWRAALSGAEVYQLRKELGRTEEWVYILTKVEDGKLAWHALDPSSGRWQRLPLMPNTQRGSLGLWPRILMDPSTKFADMLHVIAKEFNNETRVLRADPKHSCSSYPTSSSSSAATIFSSRNPDKSPETERNLWEVIAAKNFGTSQFVTCRVLAI